MCIHQYKGLLKKKPKSPGLFSHLKIIYLLAFAADIFRFSLIYFVTHGFTSLKQSRYNVCSINYNFISTLLFFCILIQFFSIYSVLKKKTSSDFCCILNCDDGKMFIDDRKNILNLWNFSLIAITYITLGSFFFK